ncbi:hypothetical protein NDU88_004064 [Pleurodeles waltl]|uniref:Uncharacterized protein n=1 Tax=Pleurodeles waltl TaxID=8319 RepID=A0AAV7VF26_PLEWA|nr:hypothetical protein NDU88_004064 [Pleurodeles waltl]
MAGEGGRTSTSDDLPFLDAPLYLMLERRGSVSPAESLASLQPSEDRKVLGASAGLPVGDREVQAPCASSSSQLPRPTSPLRTRCNRASLSSHMARLCPSGQALSAKSESRANRESSVSWLISTVFPDAGPRHNSW